LKRFQTTTQTLQDIKSINQTCLGIPPKDITLLYLFYTSKNISYNKCVFENTSKDTSPFLAQDIHFDTCPHFKLSTNPSQTISRNT
jgi:hypothetical protein